MKHVATDYRQIVYMRVLLNHSAVLSILVFNSQITINKFGATMLDHAQHKIHLHFGTRL